MEPYTFDDVARFAEDLMAADEKAAFESALAANPALQQQLALYHEVHASLQQHFTHDEQREKLQDTLQTIRNEFLATSSAPAKVVPFKRYLQRAMAVAAILIAVVFIWQPWKPALFDQYAETRMIVSVERGGATDSLLQHAVTAFNNKDFTDAAALLQKVRQHDTANSMANFYYGVALLQTNQLIPAREVFTELFAGESAFKYEAAFYLALSYLKEKNEAICKEWLQKIPADASNYNKAQELLNKLK
jgi:hypothetical protein